MKRLTVILTSRENLMSGKILDLQKKSKKGKSGRASWANRSLTPVVFPIYLEFGSSDFDETLMECSWYEKNEH